MAKKISVEMELLNKKYLQSLSKSSQQTKKNTKDMSNSFSSVAKAGVAFFAGRGIISALSSLIDVTEEQQKQEAQLNAVLKSTKNAAGLTADEIKNMASSLQEVTTFGDETILRGQNMLLTFTKIGKDVFPMATETMLDMSQAMGQDVKQTAIQLGKALNDPVKGISALSRVGVQLSDQQKQQIKDFTAVGDVASAQKVILGELKTQFGGTARAASKTLGGALKQVKNSLGDVAEDIGNKMTPSMKILAKSFGLAMKSGGFLSVVFGALGRAGANSAYIISKAFIGMSNLVNKVREKYSGFVVKKLQIQRDLILYNTGLTKLSTKEELKRAGVYEKINNLNKTIVSESQNGMDIRANTISLEENLAELEKSRIKTKKEIGENIKKNTELQKESLKTITKSGGKEKEINEKMLSRSQILKLLGKDQLAKVDDIDNKYLQLYKTLDAKELELQQFKKKGQISEIEHIESIKGLEADRATARKNQEAEIAQAQATNFASIVGQIQGVYGKLTSVITSFNDTATELETRRITELYDDRLENIETAYDKEVARIEGLSITDEERDKLLSDLDTKRAKEEERLANEKALNEWKLELKTAKLKKATSIIDAIMSTAVSVAIVAWNPILAAAAGVLGAAQVAAIAAEPLPAAPSFEVGAMDVPSDTLANIHSREMIIPKPFAEAIRNGELSIGGGGGDIIVQGSIIDYQGLMNAVDSGRNRRAYGIGGSNYAGTGVYK